MEREIRKSRSSILKPNKTRNALNELDLEDTLETSPRQPRRVSFANLNFIKPFMTDPEKNTIWDSTIEETLSHSDSSNQDGTSVDCSNKYDLNTTKILDEIDMDISQADVYEGKIWTKEIVECTEEINIQNHTTSTKCKILSSTFKNVQISATWSKQTMDSYPISNLIENKAVPVVCDEQNTDCEMELTLQNATLDEFGPVASLTSKQNRNENMQLTCRNPIMNRNKLNFTIHEKENIHFEHYINDGMEFTCQNPILYKNQFEHVNVKSKMGSIRQSLSTDECGPVPSQNIDDGMEFTCHNLILNDTERVPIFQDQTLKEFGTGGLLKQNRINDMDFTCQKSILNRDNLVTTIYGKENVYSGMRMTHQNPPIDNFVPIPVTHNMKDMELTCRKPMLNNKNETVSKTSRNKNDNNEMGSTHRKSPMIEVEQAFPISPNQNVDDCMEFTCQNLILNQNRLEQDDINSRMKFTHQSPLLNNFETNSTYPKHNTEDRNSKKKNHTVFVPPQHHGVAKTGLTHQTVFLNDTSLKENIVDGMEFTCQNPILNQNPPLSRQNLSRNEFAHVSKTFPEQNINDSMEFTCQNPILKKIYPVCETPQYKHPIAKIGLTDQNLILNDTSQVSPTTENIVDGMEFTCQNPILNQNRPFHVSRQNLSRNKFVHVSKTNPILKKNHPVCVTTPQYQNAIAKIGLAHQNLILNDTSQVSPTSPKENIVDGMEFTCQNPILNQNPPLSRQNLSRNEFAHVSKTFPEQNINDSMEFTCQNPILKKNHPVCVTTPQYQNAIAKIGLAHQNLILNDTSQVSPTSPKDNIVDGMEFTCQNPILNQNRPVHVSRQNISRNEFAHESKTFPEQNINDSMEFTYQNPILKKNHPVCVAPQYQNVIAKIGLAHQNLIMNDTSQVSPTSPKENIVDGMEFTCQNPILNQNRPVQVSRQNLRTNEFTHVNDGMESTCQNPILEQNQFEPQKGNSKTGSTHQKHYSKKIRPVSNLKPGNDSMELTCQNPALKQNRLVCVTKEHQNTVTNTGFVHQNLPPKENIIDGMEFTCQNPVLNQNRPACTKNVGSRIECPLENVTSNVQVSPNCSRENFIDGMKENKLVGVSPQNSNVDSLTSFRNNIESIRTAPAKHLTDETMNFTSVPATWKNNILSATINENKDITTVEEKNVDHEMSFDDQSIIVDKMDLVHSAIGTPSTSFHFNTLNMSPCTDDTQQLINATLNATKLHKRSKNISTNCILPEETIETMSKLGTLEEANPIIDQFMELIDKETSNRKTLEEESPKIVKNKLKKNKHKKTLNFETSKEASPTIVNKLNNMNDKETSSGETSREASPKMARNKFNKINDTYVINKLSSKTEQEHEQIEIGLDELSSSSNLLIDRSVSQVNESCTEDYEVEIPGPERMSDKLKKFVDAIQVPEFTPLPRPSYSSDQREHHAESEELNKLVEYKLKNILKKMKLLSSLTEEDLSSSKDESSEDCGKLESLCSLSNLEEETTIKQKIELASQKCDKSWEIIRIEDGLCCFKTFFGLATFSVEFIHETELVTNITTDSFLQDEKPIYHFLYKEVVRRLSMSNLGSVLGYRFDILSMLDYVQMTMVVMNDHLMEFKQLFRSHGLKMDRDCRAEFKVLNVELILILTITIDMSNMEQVDKDSITIKTDKGKVDENFLLDLVPSCCKGFGFLKNYIGKVDEYVRLLLKRRRFQTAVKH